MKRASRGFFSAAIALVGLLAACAPTAAGAYVDFPIQAKTLMGLASVTAGATTYIAVEYNPNYWGVKRETLNRLLDPQVRSKVKGDSWKAPLSGFNLIRTDAPAGWSVQLRRANAKREITDITGGYIYFADSVELIFEVTVPADAPRVKLLTQELSYEGTQGEAFLSLTIEPPKK